MIEKDKFTVLEQLLGSYFHQDWPLEHDSYRGVVDEMCASEPVLIIQAAVAELTSLLEKFPTEDNLRQNLVNEIGCYFEPNSEGLTYREWLEQVKLFLMQV